ncbi:Flp family type IVb pilin [Alsobacter sp. R-9]
MNLLKRFVRNESGATAIEYGLIAAIIAVGLIASLQALRGNLQDTFTNIGNAVKSAN